MIIILYQNKPKNTKQNKAPPQKKKKTQEKQANFKIF